MIAAACRDCECLRFAYRSRDGTDSRREVEPHSLVNLGRRWYLVAWDREPRGLAHVPRRPARQAGVDRRALHARASCPAKDAAAYVEQSIAGAPNRFEARVTLHAAAEQITQRIPAYAARSSRSTRTPATTRRATTTSSWLALRIAMLGVDFEVHEPPELLEHLRTLALRLARAAA